MNKKSQCIQLIQTYVVYIAHVFSGYSRLSFEAADPNNDLTWQIISRIPTKVSHSVNKKQLHAKVKTTYYID